MDDLGVLAGILDTAEPVVLVLRHDPHPAAQKLLATLGAGWVVDPVNGERCIRRCSRPECKVTPAVVPLANGRMPRGSISDRRVALTVRAEELRRDGLTAREIGETLGISRSYAAELLDDPDGEKGRARKDSYRQPCPHCGEPMTGSYGIAGAPERCAACAAKKQHDEAYWDEARIIATFQEFHRRYGRPPAASDRQALHPSQASRFSPKRIAETEKINREFTLPHPGSVVARFGSWNNGLIAAGFEPNRGGTPQHRDRMHLSAEMTWLIELLEERGPMRRKDIVALRGDRHIRSTDELIRNGIRRGLVKRTDYGVYQRADDSDISRERDTRMRSFIVLTRNGDQAWHELGRADAMTSDLAIEQLAGGEGEYLAIDERAFQPVKVAPVTKLAVVRE